MEQPKNTTDAKVSGSKTSTPEVTWAQRSNKTELSKNLIFLSINVPDVDITKAKLDIQPTSLTFTGYSNSHKTDYHVQLDFYAEIDPAATKRNLSSRALELALQKKEAKEEYWPRLLKESKKMHFLKTDFDKWVDEDEQDENPDDDDYMSRMGGMGAGGMGGDGGFGGIDFSKLGGAGGFGGGMGGDEDDEGEDDDEDEDLPDLGEAKPKIEEIK